MAELSAPSVIPRASLEQDTGYLEVRPSDMRNNAGAVLAASASASSLFANFPGGNVFYVQGNDAQGNTKNDNGFFDFTLPSDYVAGGTVTLRATGVVNGTGTLGTCTVDFSAYLMGADGTPGSDLVTTAATAVTAVAGSKDFTVTPTGLVAGDRLCALITASIQETGGVSAIRYRASKIQVLYAAKG